MNGSTVIVIDDTSELHMMPDAIVLYQNGARVRVLDYFEQQFIRAAYLAGMSRAVMGSHF